MKRYITINVYTPETAAKLHNTTMQCDGRWVPARPVAPRTLWERFRFAWLVFMGKVDVLKWGCGQ